MVLGKGCLPTTCRVVFRTVISAGLVALAALCKPVRGQLSSLPSRELLPGRSRPRHPLPRRRLLPPQRVGAPSLPRELDYRRRRRVVCRQLHRVRERDAAAGGRLCDGRRASGHRHRRDCLSEVVDSSHFYLAKYESRTARVDPRNPLASA